MGREQVGERRRRKGCECEREEVGESFGCGFWVRGGRVVGEIGFQAAGEGEGA